MIVDLATKERVDEELRDVKFCWAICWLGDEVSQLPNMFSVRRIPMHLTNTSSFLGFHLQTCAAETQGRHERRGQLRLDRPLHWHTPSPSFVDAHQERPSS